MWVFTYSVKSDSDNGQHLNRYWTVYNTVSTSSYKVTCSRSDDRLRRCRRFSLVYFRHISTSDGSSGDGFRIADPHFLFIFNSHYGSIWLSFRDMSMRQTDDRQTTPLLKVSLLLLQAGHPIFLLLLVLRLGYDVTVLTANEADHHGCWRRRRSPW